MKTYQVVYVVMDMENEVLLGVYDEYKSVQKALEEYNSNAVSVTPVLVNAAPDTYRQVCYSEEDMLEAVQDEIELAKDGEAEFEDEDEDEDDDDYDDDYYEDDEDDDDDDDEDYEEDWEDGDEDDSPSVHDLAQDLMKVIQRYL